MHGVFTFIMFAIADFIDQAIIFGDIAYDKNKFIDEVEPEDIDEEIRKRLE